MKIKFNNILITNAERVINMFVLKNPIPIKIVPVRLFSPNPIIANESICKTIIEFWNLSEYISLIKISANNINTILNKKQITNTVFKYFLKNKPTAFLFVLKYETLVKPATNKNKNDNEDTL